MTLSNRTALEVVNRLADHFKVDIRGREADRGPSAERFSRGVSLRRSEAMYVLRKLGMSYSDIGRLFKRDHTTVIYACRRVEERLATVVGYAEEVGILETMANGVVAEVLSRGGREKLAKDREGITHHFAITAKAEDGTVYEVDGYLTVNLFPDGRVAEFFVKLGKQGDFHAIVDQWAKAASWALQLGAPLEKFMKRFVNVRFEPAGITQNPDIPMCSSLCDYVARFLILRFGKAEVLP